MNVVSNNKLKKLLTFTLLLQFLVLINSISSVQAVNKYWVYGENLVRGYGTVGRMYIDDQDIYETQVVASSIFLYQDSENWIACGFFQGRFPYYPYTEVYEPYYYWDWCDGTVFPDGEILGVAYESYNTFELLICDTGDETWMSFEIGNNDHYDYIPYVYFDDCRVWGQGESDYSTNDMDFHHKYMKYMNMYYQELDYYDTDFDSDSPYQFNNISDTEWYSYK